MARLEEATAALAQAQARFDELVRGPRQEQIAAARANVHGAIRDLEFRAADYERTKKIREQRLASPDLLDRAKAALNAAQANLELLINTPVSSTKLMIGKVVPYVLIGLVQLA